jgi:predicted component of type VI protein secretion system
MPRTREAALTTRLERIEQLARDLVRDLSRTHDDESSAVHHAMADTIKVEIEAVVHALNRPKR